jgi:AraC-like DNA-binding protein
MQAAGTRGHSGTQPASLGSNLVTEGLVRAGALMALPRLLGEFGVDANRLLAEFGLEPAYFEDPENKIALATMGQLLARCADAAACPHFGLLVGQRADASNLGTVGFLLQSAPDVRSALAGFSAHFRLHNPSAVVSFAERDAYVAMSFRMLPRQIEGSEHILDGAMAVMYNVLRKICGPSWLPAQVRLARFQPHDVTPYRRFFHSTLIFDEHETAILFIRDWLDRTPPGADPLLHRMMLRWVERLEAHTEKGTAGQVCQLLPALIAVDHASLEAMAQRMRMKPRTLNRRLAGEGTSFVHLLDETRQAMACQLLESTQMAAFQIGESLGYSNPSAFTRAFRRWKGVGPSQWRAHKIG